MLSIPKLIGFWVSWFIITIIVGKVWPDSVDSDNWKGLISFGNGGIAFIITVILFAIFVL